MEASLLILAVAVFFASVLCLRHHISMEKHRARNFAILVKSLVEESRNRNIIVDDFIRDLKIRIGIPTDKPRRTNLSVVKDEE